LESPRNIRLIGKIKKLGKLPKHGHAKFL
jgi:hypothetical protein